MTYQWRKSFVYVNSVRTAKSLTLPCEICLCFSLFILLRYCCFNSLNSAGIKEGRGEAIQTVPRPGQPSAAVARLQDHQLCRHSRSGKAPHAVNQWEWSIECSRRRIVAREMCVTADESEAGVERFKCKVLETVIRVIVCTICEAV